MLAFAPPARYLKWNWESETPPRPAAGRPPSLLLEGVIMTLRTRRQFLSSVGHGMLVASVGASVATDLGLVTAHAEDGAQALSFGELDPLVAMMQETPSIASCP